MLAHPSGLQREPSARSGTACAAGRDDLLAGLAAAEAVLPPAGRHHYSNLGLALLGEVVSRLRGGTWEDALRDRVLEPLGMHRTTPRRTPPYAPATSPTRTPTGCWPSRRDFRRRLRARQPSCGRTVDDLARWAAFIADPDVTRRPCSPGHRRGDVLPAGDVRPGPWRLASGLGLMLHRRGERVLRRATTARCPGSWPALAVRRKEKVGRGRARSNTSGVRRPGRPRGRRGAAHRRRRPGPRPRLAPWACRAAAGRGAARPVVVGGHRLRLLGPGGAPGDQGRRRPPDRRALGPRPRRARTASGWSPAGRRASCSGVVRRDDGTVERLYWATYPVHPRPAALRGLTGRAWPDLTGG